MSSDNLINEEFPLEPGLAYLNHAAVAPWPRRTRLAVEAFAAVNASRGATDYPRWQDMEDELRKRITQLINAPSTDDVALMKSTSEAISAVAQGLDWQAGDNVVISDQEFPSNRLPWEAQKARGVEVREVDLYAADTPEDALIQAADDKTRVLAISSVQFGTGLRLNMEQLGAWCRTHGVLFCVDAIQSIGALVTDVQAMQADFVMADGHKWMLGPEGLALFHSRPEARDRLKLHQFGWHMVEHMGDYNRRDWSPASTARRFECGSPNMLGIHALNASLSLHLEIGPEQVEERLLENTRFLVERIEESNELELLSDPRPERRAGIVTFRHRKIPAPDMLTFLRDDSGVICAARGGGIRFSPHFYTSRDVMERAVRTAEQMPGA